MWQLRDCQERKTSSNSKKRTSPNPIHRHHHPPGLEQDFAMMPLTLFLNAFHQWISAGESEKVSSTAIYNLSKLLTLCNRSTAPGKSIKSSKPIYLFISIAQLRARGRTSKWRSVQSQIGQSVKQIKQIYAHLDKLGTGLCNDASDSVSQCFPSVNLSRGIRESIFNGNIWPKQATDTLQPFNRARKKSLSLQSQFIYSYLLRNHGPEVAQTNGAASKVR